MALAGLDVCAPLARVPVAARAAVALVAVYGVASLGLGAIQGVPLPALLSGASFWQRLPVILQGAVLGAAVVLPLGLIALVVSAGLRRSASRSLATEATKAVGVLTSIAIVLASAPFRALERPQRTRLDSRDAPYQVTE